MASSRNLIFLHGWGTSPSVWEKQVDFFSKKYSVITPNLFYNFIRGTRDEGRLSAEALPKAEGTILIGWSFGGMLAITLAAKKTAKYKALVLVGSNAKFTDGMNPIVIRNLRKNLNREYEQTMRDCYGTFFSAEETGFIEEFVKGRALPDKRITIELLYRLETLDLKKILKDISIPTLIIHGDKDEICPVEAGRYLNKNIKGSRLEVIKGAGHMPFYTNPHNFNRILEEFIESVK